MGRLRTIWTMLRHYKYAVVLFFIALIVGFLDENSWYSRWERLRSIEACKKEIAEYKARYDYDAACLQDLESNPMTVERLARERYYMRRPNEDVFVIRSAQPEEQAPASEQDTAAATPAPTFAPTEADTIVNEAE